MADRQGSHLVVERLASRLTRDTNRTIARFFWPETPERAQTLIDRVMGLDQREVSRLLAACAADFGDRHEDLLAGETVQLMCPMMGGWG